MKATDNDHNRLTGKAGDLLNVWRERLRIYEDGVITVSLSTKDAARSLVRRLGELDQSEDVQVSVTEQQPRVYVVRRVETGEVIAEISGLATT